MWENKWKLFPLQKSIFIMLSLGVKKLKKKTKKEKTNKKQPNTYYYFEIEKKLIYWYWILLWHSFTSQQAMWRVSFTVRLVKHLLVKESKL